MENFILIMLVTVFSILSFAKNLVTPNCKAQTQSEEVIYTSDFHWHYDLPSMLEHFEKMYLSPKRLFQRAYFDEQKKQYLLPFSDVQGGAVLLPEAFIDSVTQHIEKAFERKFIDAVFFPDMGHSHFLIPEEKYQKEYADIPVNQMNLLIQKIFNDPEIKVVYHTAEQLKSIDESGQPLADRKTQWRFYTRNLVGDNTGEKKIEIYTALDGSKANTLSEVPGFHWWGAGFNLSANENGCFSYRKDGKTYNYDISLSDLPLDPNAPGGDEP